jgi:hypothetical protein
MLQSHLIQKGLAHESVDDRMREADSRRREHDARRRTAERHRREVERVRASILLQARMPQGGSREA